MPGCCDQRRTLEERHTPGPLTGCVGCFANHAWNAKDASRLLVLLRLAFGACGTRTGTGTGTSDRFSGTCTGTGAPVPVPVRYLCLVAPGVACVCYSLRRRAVTGHEGHARGPLLGPYLLTYGPWRLKSGLEGPLLHPARVGLYSGTVGPRSCRIP